MVAAATDGFVEFLIRSLGFRHRGLLIGEEARLGGVQGAHTLPRHAPTLGRAWGAAVALWPLFGCPSVSVFVLVNY